MLDAFDFSQQDCGSVRLSIIRRSEAVKPFQFLSFRLSGTLESQPTSSPRHSQKNALLN
jgi:hypothetical protein